MFLQSKIVVISILMILLVDPSQAKKLDPDFWINATPKQMHDIKINTIYDEYGLQPIHAAALYNSNPSVIVELIELGANVNAEDEAQATPLTIAAARNSNPKIITALLNYGARINHSDWFGSALHGAVTNENIPMIIKLIEEGIDTSIKDELWNKTAYQSASSDKIKDAIRNPYKYKHEKYTAKIWEPQNQNNDNNINALRSQSNNQVRSDRLTVQSSSTQGSSFDQLECLPLPPACQDASDDVQREIANLGNTYGINDSARHSYCAQLGARDASFICEKAYKDIGKMQCAELSKAQGQEYERILPSTKQTIDLTSAIEMGASCKIE